MKRKYCLLLVVMICLSMSMNVSLAQQQTTAAEYSIHAAFDHPNQIYRCGEQAKMTFSVVNSLDTLERTGSVEVVLSNDNGNVIRNEKYPLDQSNPISLTETMTEPGFLHVRLMMRNAKGKILNVMFDAGLAFEPEKIRPAIKKPDDFDAFLEEGKKEVRQIPIDVKMEKIQEMCNQKMDIYQISFATLNNARVYGFLSVPKGKKGPFPAIVLLPGAGPGHNPDISFVKDGFIALAMNVFPYPVPIDSKERIAAYNEYNKSLGIRYSYYGAQDRKTYFFRPMYLGVDRAIDWLVARDDVMKGKIGIYGASQGGASALILAGMNTNIRYVVAGVPALCDHNANEVGRAAGWPQLLKVWKEDPEVAKAAPYMDAVHFATRIQVPCRVTVGFIDSTCSPSSVYAAYNMIPVKDKQIANEIYLGHRVGPSYGEARRWLCKKLTE